MANVSDWDIGDLAMGISESIFLSCIRQDYVFSVFFTPYLNASKKSLEMLSELQFGL